MSNNKEETKVQHVTFKPSVKVEVITKKKGDK